MDIKEYPLNPEVNKKLQGIFKNTLNWMIVNLYQNLGDAAKTALWRKIIALNANIRKEQSVKINYVCFHLKMLKKKSKLNSKEGG